MPVRPVAADVHQRIGFDGEDFGSSNVRFPGWKVPELVGEVEDVLPTEVAGWEEVGGQTLDSLVKLWN